MMKIFNKRKTVTQEFKDLVNLQCEIIERMDELKQLEQSIDNQMKELNETINVAKEYLALCGYTEKDIEHIMIKNRMKVIRN